MTTEQWSSVQAIAYRIARARGIDRFAADDVASEACLLAARGYNATMATRYAIARYWRDRRKRQACQVMDVASTPAVPASETLDGLALTPRQQAICDLLTQGMTQVQVASALQLTACMVSRTISEIRSKVMQ